MHYICDLNGRNFSLLTTEYATRLLLGNLPKVAHGALRQGSPSLTSGGASSSTAPTSASTGSDAAASVAANWAMATSGLFTQMTSLMKDDASTAKLSESEQVG